jgi:hypothetical protein
MTFVRLCALGFSALDRLIFADGRGPLYSHPHGPALTAGARTVQDSRNKGVFR